MTGWQAGSAWRPGVKPGPTVQTESWGSCMTSGERWGARRGWQAGARAYAHHGSAVCEEVCVGEEVCEEVCVCV